jgi:hypothetical protein
MTNQTRPFRHSVILAMCCVVALPMLGCEDPPPPEPENVTARPVDPGPPPATSIEDLMAQYDIDERIWMDERQAPRSDEERIGLLTFFDGFATGRADRLRPFFGPIELEELATLEASGELAQLAADIEGIEIWMGVTNEGSKAVLGLYEFADRVEGQMWEIVQSPRAGGGYLLVAAYAPPGLSESLGRDAFDDWYAAVQAEQAKLNLADLGLEAARGRAAGTGSGDPNAGPEGDSGGGPSGPGI